MRDRVFVQMALVLMLLVTACSQTPAPRSTPSPASDKVVTIRVGLYDNEPSLDAVIAAFQDKYPYYRVEQVQLGMPIDSMERLKKGEVDVVSDALTVGMLHLEGVATSLDPFIAKSRIDLAPYGAPLESLRIDGHSRSGATRICSPTTSSWSMPLQLRCRQPPGRGKTCETWPHA